MERSILSKFSQQNQTPNTARPVSFYCHKLQKGETLDDILKTATSDEQQFLSKHLNVLKVYENGLIKQTLTKTIPLIKAGVSLNEVIENSNFDEFEMLCTYLSNLKIVQQMNLTSENES
jgi:hypothetical protein